MGKIKLKKLKIDIDQIRVMEKLERVHFINTLGGFKSVALIGTKNHENLTNLAIIDSIVHVGSNPPLFGIIFRPGVVERQTLENIIETGFYTINHVTESFFKQAHQTSARYPKEISEFEATGLTTEYKNDFFAPFVAESHVQIAVEFQDQIHLSINNTVLVIGKIQAVYFPADCLFEDGALDLEKAGSLTSLGLDSYHKTTKIGRLSYAKPDKIPEELNVKYLK